VTGRARRGLGIALSLLTLGGTGFMVWRMVVTRAQARHVQRAADEWEAYRACLLGKDADTDAPKAALRAREVATNAPDPTWPARCNVHLASMAKALGALHAKDPRLVKLRDEVDHAVGASTPVTPHLDDLWLAAKILPARGPAPSAPGPPTPTPPATSTPPPPAGADVALVGPPTVLRVGDHVVTAPETSLGAPLMGAHAACGIALEGAAVTGCRDTVSLDLGARPWLAATADPARLLAFVEQPARLVDVADGKVVLAGTLTSAAALAGGTIAAVRKVGDGSRAELVRIGADGAEHRTALPPTRGEASLVADELVWTDARGHLVTRHVTAPAAPLGPPVDHGESVRSYFRGCRTAHGLAVTAERNELRGRVMHTDVRVVFRDGDAWSAPVSGETSWTPMVVEPLNDDPTGVNELVAPHLQLTCEDDAAVLTSIAGGRVEELRCTRAGCAHQQSAPLTFAPPTEAGSVAATHVGHDVLVVRIAALPGVVFPGRTLTLRVRRAPLAKLAAARETVIATDDDHGGWLTWGIVRLTSTGTRALLLIEDGASTRAITIDAAGHATPVSAPADPVTRPR
jgi:hypothetical protein